MGKKKKKKKVCVCVRERERERREECGDLGTGSRLGPSSPLLLWVLSAVNITGCWVADTQWVVEWRQGAWAGEGGISNHTLLTSS